MKDLENADDIKLLVDSFYGLVQDDPLLGPIFNDVAGVNWEHHLPRMYSFWESVLFGKAEFKGNPMQSHIELAKRTTLDEQQFETWKKLWGQSIDRHFRGAMAEEARQRAGNIAALMLYKIRSKF